MNSDPATRIRALGARVTPARLAVLRLLEGADRALSHHDVEAALSDLDIDRVTLYRVLDWLVESGLAHRVTDAQRVFRFSLAAPNAPQHDQHAHFRCEDCGKVFCLDDVQIAQPALPKGFSAKSVGLSVTGQCAQCDRHTAAK
ncbi:MAG: Fe2+/Zn2+ uptake regulation protein [Rhodocyclales bacterium]|nr:Fe2+/Zn2+ uptake regulation protein [Rhodocyclales bacterium]